MSTLEIRDYVFIITPEGAQILPNANYSIKYGTENFHMTPQKSTTNQFLHLLPQKKSVPSLSYYLSGMGPASISLTTLQESQVRAKILDSIATESASIIFSPLFPPVLLLPKGTCHKGRQGRPWNPLDLPGLGGAFSWAFSGSHWCMCI